MELKLRVNKKTMIYILMLFIIATPGYISHIGGKVMDYFLLVGELLTYAFIFVKWVKTKRISPILILSILMYGTIVFSTWINGGNVYQAFRVEIGYIMMIMLIDNEEKNIDCLWKACIIYLSTVITINFITIILFPDGMYDVYTSYNDKLILGQTQWFFSSKNGIGKPILFLLYFKSDYDYRKYKKLQPSFYFIAAICFLSLISIWSATSMVSCALMIIMVLLAGFIHNKTPKIYNINTFLVIIAFLFVAFVILHIIGIFSGFVTYVLNKNLTFNGRTPIWSISIFRILSRPIIGYGYLSKEEFRMLIGRRPASDAHNYLLTLGVYGGFVAMIIFIIIVLLIAKSIKKKQYEYSGIIITAFVFTFFLTMLFENTTSKLYWLILVYAYYLGSNHNNTTSMARREDYV